MQSYPLPALPRNSWREGPGEAGTGQPDCSAANRVHEDISFADSEPDRFLAIYLNDHLAGATLGVELARRLRSSSKKDEMGSPLGAICTEIEVDRETLEGLMERLEIRLGLLKRAGAWSGEKLGRLKLNGRLTGHSSLSRLIELELLYIGITGKMQLWKALEQTIGPALDEFDFEQLIERAASQRGVIAGLHLKAAASSLPPAMSPTDGSS